MYGRTCPIAYAVRIQYYTAPCMNSIYIYIYLHNTCVRWFVCMHRMHDAQPSTPDTFQLADSCSHSCVRLYTRSHMHTHMPK